MKNTETKNVTKLSKNIVYLYKYIHVDVGLCDVSL